VWPLLEHLRAEGVVAVIPSTPRRSPGETRSVRNRRASVSLPRTVAAANPRSFNIQPRYSPSSVSTGVAAADGSDGSR